MISTYGPGAVTLVQNLVSKIEAGGTVTLADVEAEFNGLKPYGAYGIRQAGTPAAPLSTPVAGK
jgi:hypothetical protein